MIYFNLLYFQNYVHLERFPEELEGPVEGEVECEEAQLFVPRLPRVMAGVAGSVSWTRGWTVYGGSSSVVVAII
jgi:hypothetical protein